MQLAYPSMHRVAGPKALGILQGDNDPPLSVMARGKEAPITLCHTNSCFMAVRACQGAVKQRAA